jgi:hypothetical protein
MAPRFSRGMQQARQHGEDWQREEKRDPHRQQAAGRILTI